MPLLADTFISDIKDEAGSPPIFSLGFELTHVMMKQKIQKKQVYNDLFNVSFVQIERKMLKLAKNQQISKAALVGWPAASEP